jgi:hypothetical protein
MSEDIRYGFIGLGVISSGFVSKHFWAVVLILAQLWQIDRSSLLYEWFEDQGSQSK